MSFQQKVHKFLPTVIIALAAILLFFAQSSYWVNHTIFNKASFSEITTTALLSESSREALSTTIIDKGLADRPIAKKAVGDKASSVISGLLDSDLSHQAVALLSNAVYKFITSTNQEDIVLDLSSVKPIIERVSSLVQDNTGKTLQLTQNQIPDEITIIERDSFPNLSGTVKTMLWLGPLLWLSVILLFSSYIYIGRKDYARRVYTVGTTIIAVSLLGLVVLPFIPPPVAAAIPNIELRPVAQNLASGFLEPFRTQMYTTIGIVLTGLLIFNQRFNILGVFKSLETKLNKKTK